MTIFMRMMREIIVEVRFNEVVTIGTFSLLNFRASGCFVIKQRTVFLGAVCFGAV